MEENKNADPGTNSPASGPSTQTHTTNNAPSQNNQGNVDCTITQNVIMKHKDAPVTKLPGCSEPPANFTGRSNFLSDLHKLVEHVLQQPKQSTLSHLLVITGLGGIGKSTVARKYAKEYKDKYFNGNVAWINAETRGSATSSFREIATELKIDNWNNLCTAAMQKDDTDPLGAFHRLVDGVYKHLNTHQEAFGRALFIFDNAQQLGKGEGEFEFGLTHCLPKKDFSFLPVFLATSRTRYWGFLSDKIKTRPLEKLTRDETKDFICTTLCISKEDAKRYPADGQKNNRILNQLCDIFDGFSLGLKLAMGVISSDWSETTTFGRKIQSAENYIAEFNQNVVEWAEREIPETVEMDHQLIMSNIWEITIKRIKLSQKDGVHALRLLQLCAFLPPDSISCRFLHIMYNNMDIIRSKIMNLTETACKETLSALKLLQKFSMLELDEIEEDPLENSEELREYLKRIEKYVYGEGSGKIHIHRLVQTMERTKLMSEGECPKDSNQNSNLFSPTIAVLRFLFQNIQWFNRTEQTGSILECFKGSKWPNGSYKDCLTLSYWVQGRGVCHPVSVPKDIYHFLQNKLKNQSDEKLVVLCKLLITYQQNYFIFNNIKKPELNFQMDGFSFFAEEEGLSDSSLSTFLQWLLDKAQKDLNNRWLQAETVQIFDKMFQAKVINTQQNEFTDRLVKWLRVYHTEVLHKPKPIPPEFGYQRTLESRFKNMQTTSELLFKLAARFLSMEEAIAMLVKTMEVSANGKQQHEEFNCWRYFDNNLFQLPGIPWDLWGNADKHLAAKPICKTLVHNRPFLELLLKRLEIFTKNKQGGTLFKRTFTGHREEAVTKLDEDRLSSYLIILLAHVHGTTKDELTSQYNLPLLLKDALWCFIDKKWGAKFDPNLPYLVVCWLALLQRLCTASPDLKQITKLSVEEATWFMRVLGEGSKLLQKYGSRMMDKHQIISEPAKENFFLRIKIEISTFLEFSRKPDFFVDLDLWVQVAKKLDTFVSNWEGIQILSRRKKALKSLQLPTYGLCEPEPNFSVMQPDEVKDCSKPGKIRIRPFPMVMDVKYAELLWLELEIAILDLLVPEQPAHRFQELYRLAYTLVLHKYGRFCYTRLKTLLSNHMKFEMENKILASAFYPLGLTEIISGVWLEFTWSLETICDIFMYLERVYVQKNNLEELIPLGHSIFKKEILAWPEVCAALKEKWEANEILKNMLTTLKIKEEDL